MVGVHSIGESAEPYSPKQLFGKIKTFADLTETVLYVPFVFNLISQRQGIRQTTDIFSNNLMQVLGAHPLIIAGTEAKVFEAMPPILLTPEQRTDENKIYVVPKEAWNSIADSMTLVSAVDQQTGRFYVLRLYEEEIPCPLGQYRYKTVKAWFCNLYGNKETYYFAKGINNQGASVMRLHYAPPIQEFVDLGNRILGLLHGTQDKEEAYTEFAESTDVSYLPAVNKEDKLQAATAPKPLNETQLTAKQRADCCEMIKMYHRVYGEQGNGE